MTKGKLRHRYINRFSSSYFRLRLHVLIEHISHWPIVTAGIFIRWMSDLLF